jgi:trehalose 6-phosphate synthase
MSSTKQSISNRRFRDTKVVIAADGQTRTHKRQGERISARVPAGGVSVALDRVSQQTHATFISRARTDEDVDVLNDEGKVAIRGRDGSYTLKRLQLSPEELDAYYFGFSNQSLWPLFHSAVDRVVVRQDWFEGYAEVSRRFAEAIQAEIDGPTLVWVNDYQLTLVPSFLECGSDVTIALFWHIPWPVPDILRRLPEREAILRSMLRCDLIGFHTEEYARNFLEAAALELGAAIDHEALTARLDRDEVRVTALPLGIDAEAIREVARVSADNGSVSSGGGPEEDEELAEVSRRNAILLGVDRLDYSKGIPQRLIALDRLFERYPDYRDRVAYVGIMSPTREAIPAYQQLKQEVMDLEAQINDKHRQDNWQPLYLRYDGLPRPEVLRLYTRAAVCLVTSVADGMNLVAKEFVTAAACVKNPGMLVLSEFAGASNDLHGALIVNPHDVDAMADGIHTALQMPRSEKRSRLSRMARQLERDNVYTWAQTFMDEAMGMNAGRSNRVA